MFFACVERADGVVLCKSTFHPVMIAPVGGGVWGLEEEEEGRKPVLLFLSD